MKVAALDKAIHYTYMSGTSFSSPLVAGIAARYLSAAPTSTPEQVSKYIVDSATPGVIADIPANTVNKFAYAYPGNMLMNDATPGALRSYTVYPSLNSLGIDYLEPSFTGITHPLLGYKVKATPNNGKPAVLHTFANGPDTWGNWLSMDGLAPGVKYTLTITPYSSLGDGVPVTSKPTIVYALPSAPQNLWTKTLGAHSVVVAWNAPKSLGFAPLNNYQYATSTDGLVGKKWTSWKSAGKAGQVTVFGLTANSRRLFKVRTTTDAGESITAQIQITTSK
jgi:subtilisin family serine protease